MRRLYPIPDIETDVARLYDVVRSPHPDGRPWLGICMVASLDGSTVVDGASSALSNPRDVEVLHTLRRLADVIIVGAGTVRAEGYGPPKTPGQRIGVVTSTGDVDVTSSLFTSGAGFLICSERTPVAAHVDALRAGRDGVDLALALARLGEVSPGASFVQAEGGPALNGALLDADLVDELDLTISSRLVGGSGPRVAIGGRDTSVDFDLAHLAVDEESFVFSRWVRRRAC